MAGKSKTVQPEDVLRDIFVACMYEMRKAGIEVRARNTGTALTVTIDDWRVCQFCGHIVSAANVVDAIMCQDCEREIEQMRKRETGDDEWSTPAVYWAAVKVGGDLRAHPYAAIKGRWAAALDDAIDGIRTGKLPAAVPQRHEALPAPGQCSVPPEVAKQRLANIRDMLARKMTMQ